MRIKLDREKKITLLKALKEGFIDDREIRAWLTFSDTPREEIERELDRLTKIQHPDTCNRLKRLGLCSAKQESRGSKGRSTRLQ